MRAPPPRPAPIPFVTESEPPLPGRPTEVAAGVFRLVAPNPGPFTYSGTNTYVVRGGDGAIVIDPGPEDVGHAQAIMDCAGGAVTAILLTHTHRDHSAGAPALSARTGAPIMAGGRHPVPPDAAPPALDEGADFVTEPHRCLTDGEAAVLSGRPLTAIATPGHVANHFCFALDDLLFTGDHVMGWSTTVIAPPEGDMTQYLASLDRLIARGHGRILPGHGRPIEAPAPFLRALKDHRLWREAVILHALQDEGGGLAEAIRAAAYPDLPATLHVAATLTTQAHLERLCALGHAVRDGQRFRPA